MINYPPRATLDQRKHIDRLTIRVGLKTYAARNEFISKQLGRKVDHLIDLTIAEASAVIDVLLVEARSKTA